MMISQDDYLLERFSRHVPTVVCCQIISRLVEQYLEPSPQLRGCSLYQKELSVRSSIDLIDERQAHGEHKIVDDSVLNSIAPSIERFHAALLFVDISGFTVLSQRLNVDDLRYHINAYFKKILDIVHNYSGDVVKFAGDALFIIFQTAVQSSSESTLHHRQYLLCPLKCNNFSLLMRQMTRVLMKLLN